LHKKGGFLDFWLRLEYGGGVSISEKLISISNIMDNLSRNNKINFTK